MDERLCGGGASVASKHNIDVTTLPVLVEMLRDLVITAENEGRRLERYVDRIAPIVPTDLGINKTESIRPDQEPNLHRALSSIIDDMRQAQARIIRNNQRLLEYTGGE